MSRRRLAFVAVAAVFVLLFGGRWLALRYTEQLWFADLGQGERFRWLLLRGLAWQATTFIIAFAWYGAHTFGVYGSIGSVHLPRRLGNLDIDEAVPSRTLRAIAIAMAALLAAVTTYTFGDLDQYIALARNAAPYGLTEPVLHRDAAFYLAVLPLLEILHLFATVATLLAAVLVVGLYALTGSFAVSRRRVRITPHARTHLVILLSALALVVAWGFQLDAWQMVAGGGHAHGALSPSDRSVRIPASHALAAIGLVAAVGSVMALRLFRPPLLFALWVTLGVAAVLGRFALPVMTEAWGSAGNPALVQSLGLLGDDHSRRAFGLLDLPGRAIPAGGLPADSAAALVQAAEGLYAWGDDGGVPARLLDEQAGDTTALRLWTVTSSEAMNPGGRLVPAAIAVAQTNPVIAERQLPRPRWTMLHRQALAWGGEPVAIDAGLRAGPLRFFAALAPAESAAGGTPLRRANGRVRFLPRPAELGIVGPDENRPGDAAPGILLHGMVRRTLLAWALQAPPLLDEHASNADRILYWRDVPARLARLYPFAAFGTARAALLEGRLTWIADGYLLSPRFPLAETVRWNGEEINYLSSPYVATVDAADGLTRFYLRPSANAFTASVARASALTPLPADSMPAALRRALRYPAALLGAQAAMLARLGDRNSGGVPWSLAWPDTTVAGHDVAGLPATLVVMALDDGGVRPWQIMPIADGRGDHLVALLAGTVSRAGEVQLELLRLQGDAAPTSQTAASRIGASPGLLAAALSVSGAAGAPRRGPVLIVPAAGTVAYLQPLFTTGNRQDSPYRLQGVAIYADGRIGFGSDVRGAVRSLQRGDAQGMLTALAGAELAEARAAFLALDSARQSADWERFGRAWSSLRRVLHADTTRRARP
jgi:hypothetical protein